MPESIFLAALLGSFLGYALGAALWAVAEAIVSRAKALRFPRGAIPRSGQMPPMRSPGAPRPDHGSEALVLQFGVDSDDRIAEALANARAGTGPSVTLVDADFEFLDPPRADRAYNDRRPA